MLPLLSHKVDTLPVLVISSSNSLLRLTQDLYSMSGIKITLPAIDAPPLLVSHYYCLLPLYSIQGVNIKRKIKIKKEKLQSLLQFFYCVGIALSSRAASSQVLSALMSLTTVFGMGTGGPSSPKTPTYVCTIAHPFHSAWLLYTLKVGLSIGFVKLFNIFLLVRGNYSVFVHLVCRKGHYRSPFFFFIAKYTDIAIAIDSG